MLALILDNQIISEHRERTWITLPNGHVASAIDGSMASDGYSFRKIADADPVPAGKRITGTTAQMVAGVPKYVHDLEDIVVTDEQINTERDRRIAQGSTFSIVGGLTISATGRDRDMTIFEAKKSEAQAKIAAGDTSASVLFRDANNENFWLTPEQMIDLYQQGVAWIQAVMVVSWAMKDREGDFANGVPLDFADDGYWP